MGSSQGRNPRSPQNQKKQKKKQDTFPSLLAASSSCRGHAAAAKSDYMPSLVEATSAHAESTALWPPHAQEGSCSSAATAGRISWEANRFRA
eukprot:scaffold803_cov310-Pinguiococcus_pyrenoidosus.AAC.134